MPPINPQIQITNAVGFRKALSNTSGVSPYPSSYGSNWNSFFKPFTTSLLAAMGIPRYRAAATGFIPSGTLGASSSGLNPYGYQTYTDGILSGSSSPTNIESSINPADVRTHGIKTPNTYVGWGYDNFGYPAPNSVSGWTIGGNQGVGSAPGNTFLAITSGSTQLFSTHGSRVFHSEYLAAPLDLRYDINRKVWTGPQSVYAGRISRVLVNGSPATGTTSEFAENVKYDVMMYDGVANTLTLRNVTPVNARPLPSSYRVNPATSGSSCLIVHALVSGIPSFGTYINETPSIRANTVFEVKVTNDGGSAGSAMSDCSYTYTVTNDAADFIYGTGLTPKKRRFSNVPYTATPAGSEGLGYYNASNIFALFDANELPEIEVCATG